MPSLKRVLQGKAASTLRKHFPGRRRWCSFAQQQQCALVNPPLQFMVRFFQALAEAKHGVFFLSKRAAVCSWCAWHVRMVSSSK